MITLTINGKEVQIEDGATILEACELAGSKVPTLCHDKRLLPFGACRICLVEVEKTRTKFTPSCSTPATEGMVVKTTTPEIIKARKTILELLLINHPLDCPICDKAGECTLQELVYEYGVSENRFKGKKLALPVDHLSPLIERNLSRCVLCGKCVRICNEVQAVGEISFINRGMKTYIGTDFDRSLDCEFCGQCISICPVGALNSRLFKYKARVWDLKETVTLCPYCSNGCSLVLGVKDNEIKRINSCGQVGINEGNLCSKGRFGYEFVNHPERLKKPLLKKDGQFKEVTWTEALDFVFLRLDKIKIERGAGSIGALGSARLTNEEVYLFQKLIGQGIGSRHFDYGGGYSYQGLVGLKEALGYAASTNSISEIRRAESILLLRADLNETHPNIKVEVNLAVNRNKAKLIIANYRRTKLSPQAEINLIYKPGTEVTLINGMIKVIIENDLINKSFINEKTEGVEKLKLLLEKYTPTYVEKVCKISPQELEKAAKIYAKTEKALIIVATGMAWGGNDKDIAYAVSNLALITGHLGKESTGVYFLGEKNNSQGVLDLGALSRFLPGSGSVDSQEYRALEMLEPGRLKAMYIVGENPLLTYPLPKIKEALEALEFLIVQDMFMTKTAELADVVLPICSFAEKEGTYTNLERRVQKLKKALPCLGESKPDLEIFTNLCRRWGVEVPQDIWLEIVATIPMYKEIDKPWGGSILYIEKDWKGKFIAVEDQEISFDDKLLLVFTPGHLYSGSLSAWNLSLLKVGEPMVEINDQEAKRFGVEDGDEVIVSSKKASVQVKVKISSEVPKYVAVVHLYPTTNMVCLLGKEMMPIEGSIKKI
ncbi:NADH-quinone oxidoreductase subunit NuoG [bacterium]|nr:NADH-quinone oxidoreductase subunit NuoG [bacterium]MBU1153998.1 NADH-quinone oxidoreductase subunit NuoG [bacterium]MBU1782632.1 NADH-quinone oxidoreductase subunit NuoG [bacterium]